MSLLDHYVARLVFRWIIFPLDLANSAVTYVARSLYRSISLPLDHFFARFDQVHRYIHMPLDHYFAQLVCRWIILPLDLAKSAVTYVARSLCRSISLLLDHSAARFGQVHRYTGKKPWQIFLLPRKAHMGIRPFRMAKSHSNCRFI